MKANRAAHRVATMCRVLGVSSSGYYAWRSRTQSARARRDEELGEAIRAIHEDSRGTYGMARVHAELVARGWRVSRKRVARLMREAGLVGVSRRRGVRTTRADSSQRAAPDRVERHFQADAPDRIWVADITYVPTWAGFFVPGRRARCVQPPSRGMVDSQSSSHRAGAQRAEHGLGSAPTRAGHPSFRPGDAVHLARLWQTMSRDGGHSLDRVGGGLL